MKERVLRGRTLGVDRAGQETGLGVAVRCRAAALVLLQVLQLLLFVIIAAQRVVKDFVAESDSFSCTRGARRLVAVRGATGLLTGRIWSDNTGPVGDGQSAIHLRVD